jgi:hypothetical protein
MKNIRNEWFLGSGLFLLVVYAVFAWTQNNFYNPDFYYQRNFDLFMKGTPIPFFYSQVSKIILLLPATVCLSIAFMKSDFQFPLLPKISDRYIVLAILSVATILLVISIQFLFQETEVTDDENTYDFQAQTLLAGRIANPPPPVLTSFDNVFIINDGKVWSGRYTMGHPAIIALGMVVGNRYVGIIAMSILTLLLTYAIGKELFEDKRIALLAIYLGSISPFFYLVSSSRLSHTTSAFFLAVFLYLFLRAKKANKFHWSLLLSFLAGCSLGYAFNTRPWTAFAWSLPFLFMMVKDSVQFSKFAIHRGIMLVIGFSMLFVFALYANSAVTENPILFPYSYYNSGEHIGFSLSGHTPIVGLRNLLVSITRLNFILFGFPVSLIFFGVFLFGKKALSDRLLLGIIICCALFYMGFYSPGISDLGPVYYYEMLIPLLLLSARGIIFIHEKFSAYITQGIKFIQAFLVISFIGACTTSISERIIHIARLTENIRKPYDVVQSSSIHNAIVMIQSFPPSGWVFGFRNPSPQFTDDIIYCKYTDSTSNHTIVDYFHTRSSFILKYDLTPSCFVLLPVKNTVGEQDLLCP